MNSNGENAYYNAIIAGSHGPEFLSPAMVAEVMVDESDGNAVLTDFEFLNGENETTIFNGT